MGSEDFEFQTSIPIPRFYFSGHPESPVCSELSSLLSSCLFSFLSRKPGRIVFDVSPSKVPRPSPPTHRALQLMNNLLTNNSEYKVPADTRSGSMT